MQLRIGWATLPRASSVGTARVSRAAQLQRAGARDDALDNALGATSKLRGALGDLRDVLGRAGVGSRPARISSSAAVGLDTGVRSTTLSSTEEINTTPTSYGDREPTWQNGSSAGVTIGGTYNGDQGTRTLT
ncbi:MAG: hypothetical protein AAF211_22820, partial [Myxococcota bacterium]